MSKIISINKAIKLSKNLHSEKKTLVLAGGCFDILHLGHIKFLKNAKKQGNCLFILLESDESVKNLKGKQRPIHPQTERAEILSAISFVDYIIPLPKILSDREWDKLIVNLNPDIIAVTKGHPQIDHNKRQARLVNAKVIEVIARIDKKSSTDIANIIAKDF
jgi:FAD synthetase